MLLLVAAGGRPEGLGVRALLGSPAVSPAGASWPLPRGVGRHRPPGGACLDRPAKPPSPSADELRVGTLRTFRQNCRWDSLQGGRPPPRPGLEKVGSSGGGSRPVFGPRVHEKVACPGQGALRVPRGLPAPGQHPGGPSRGHGAQVTVARRLGTAVTSGATPAREGRSRARGISDKPRTLPSGRGTGASAASGQRLTCCWKDVLAAWRSPPPVTAGAAGAQRVRPPVLPACCWGAGGVSPGPTPAPGSGFLPVSGARAPGAGGFLCLMLPSLTSAHSTAAQL